MDTTHAPGRLDPETLGSEVEAGSIDTVLLAMTDMQGRLQGKRLKAIHFLGEVVEHDAEGCNYPLAVDGEMNTVDRYAMSSWERGYGDFVFKPDMDTLGYVPWQEVAYGGGIEQHLPDVAGHEDHRHTPGTFADHEVELETGSLAARAVGAERAPVKSHHHQGVGEIGNGLVVTGRSDDDAVEALEDPSCPFVLGVLWPPEEDENSQLIKALVSEVS